MTFLIAANYGKYNGVCLLETGNPLTDYSWRDALDLVHFLLLRNRKTEEQDRINKLLQGATNSDGTPIIENEQIQELSEFENFVQKVNDSRGETDG